MQSLRVEPVQDGSVAIPAIASVSVDLSSSDSLERFEVNVRLSALLPELADYPARYAGALWVIDQRSGRSLVPTRFDSLKLTRAEFRSDDQSWLPVYRSIDEPALTFMLAAPLDPFIRPFQQTARQGLLALLIVVLIAGALAVALTRRVTSSLEQLVVAADAVGHGDLERQVQTQGEDDVSRVGRAFNVMTESLRGTLRELSQRRALAAVGEFASALAHEIRNPLTSIRLDLQLVQEKIPADSRGHGPLARALKEIERLNRTVSDGLKVARSGRIQLERIDLREPLEVAAHAARPEFDARRARMEPPQVNGKPVWVNGDSAALKQLFLNLLINAAQALAPGGRAGTRVETTEEHVTVAIWDNGPGIPADKLRQVWEPFYSTKEEGTGLGLAISQRIVAAHGGEIDIDTAAEHGTTFRIRLPLAANRVYEPT